MPYTIIIVPFDFGGFYIPVFTPFIGTLISLSPPFGPPDTALSTPAAPTTLIFPSPTSPPSGAAAVLVRDIGGPGDLFRSGVVGALPPSPGSLTVFTFPTISLSFPTIAAALTGGAPLVSGFPTAASVLAAALSAGTFVPYSLTITGVVATTSLAITVTGTLVAQVSYFFTRTYGFTLTFTAVPAPSGDVNNRNRILRVTATGATLITTPLPSFLFFVLGPAIAGIAATMVEGLINSKIASDAAVTLDAMALRLSPTAVICARRAAVVGSSGVVLQLMSSDLFGAAVLPVLLPPKNFAVAVTPPPQAGTRQAYTVAVTDIATGNPVPGANVTLHNFGVNGNSVTDGPRTADGSGWVLFDVALRGKIVTRVVIVTEVGGGTHGPVRQAERVLISPTLTVALAGFNTHTMTLLPEVEIT